MKCLLLFYGVCVLRALQFKNIKNAQAFPQITHWKDSQWPLMTNHPSSIVFEPCESVSQCHYQFYFLLFGNVLLSQEGCYFGPVLYTFFDFVLFEVIKAHQL